MSKKTSLLSETMTKITELKTERLSLRQWRISDYRLFAELNADPDVMKYFPSVLVGSESDALAHKIESLIEKRGWGLWAVELESACRFIGFVGLNKPEMDLPCNPCVEIGWRLARECWGYGYATEAAREVLNFAFETLCLNEVVSFTSIMNKRSQGVMQRLGMINTGRNFEHPSIPVGHKLREHVLYKITRDQWAG